MTGADPRAHKGLSFAHTVLLPYLFDHHLCVEGAAEGPTEYLQSLHGHARHDSHLSIDDLVDAGSTV